MSEEMRDAINDAIGEDDFDESPNEVIPPTEAIETSEVAPVQNEMDSTGNITTGLEPTKPANEGEYKPPQSWGVPEREAWANVPPNVQAQIDKREREVQQALTTTGEARKFQEEFNQAVTPFQHFIQAEGATPMQAVGNLLQTAATLQGGSPGQKAQRIAELIQHYGIDVGQLDDILSGQMPTEQPQDQLAQMLDQRLQPMTQFMQQQQYNMQQQQVQAQQETQSQIQSFMAQHEFAGDLKMQMADLMEMAGRRGESMDLNQAYEKAILLNPEIQQVIQQRTQAAQAGQKNQQMGLKRSAAVSVPGGEAMQGGGAAPTSMRDQIMSAMSGD